MQIQNRWILLALASWSVLSAQVDNTLLEDMREQELVVDMRNPVYKDGILSSQEGGVISGVNFRLQGRSINYSKAEGNHRVIAEGDLMLQYGERIFIGDHLDYNFETRCGVLTCGRTSIDPWFIGGETIELSPDGSFCIYDGFVTTCHDRDTDWQLRASYAEVYNDNIMKARNIQFRFVKIPLFWVPAVKIDLSDLFDAPFRYRLSYGGKSGLQISVRQRIWTWENWKAFLRLDYRLRRGFGGGIETEYLSSSGNAAFYSRNYWANDGSLFKKEQRSRYRIEGTGHWLVDGDPNFSVDYRYDKLSDEDFASDYHENQFDLETAERTELLVRKKQDNWIADAATRIRVNKWQTVRQEIPQIHFSHRPLSLGDSGIIAQNSFSMGYLAMDYAEDINGVSDFDSTRFQYSPRLYRSFHQGALSVTPELGLELIAYGDSPNSQGRIQAIGVGQVDAHLSFHKLCCPKKYVETVFTRYRYISHPSTHPSDTYIFDIRDGWYRVSLLDFGNSFTIYKKRDCHVHRLLHTRIWASRFFGTDRVTRNIPRIYSSILWNPSRYASYSLDSSWDLKRQNVGQVNGRAELTFSDDLAASVEFRRRNPYTWRKVDPDNFVLDFLRSEGTLRASPLSDRRDTLLTHIFYRFNDAWWAEAKTRTGWRRAGEPNYLEWELALSTLWNCSWKVQLSYQNLEHEQQVGFNVTLRDSRPDKVPFTRIPLAR